MPIHQGIVLVKVGMCVFRAFRMILRVRLVHDSILIMFVELTESVRRVLRRLLSRVDYML